MQSLGGGTATTTAFACYPDAMPYRSLAARSGLSLVVLLGGCGSNAGPRAPTSRASERHVPAPMAADVAVPAPATLGASLDLECGAWTSHLPVGATFTGSSCRDDNGGEIDPATRVGVLGGASNYQVVLDGCEVFVEIAGGGRPTANAAAPRRIALPRSRFGFARSQLVDQPEGAVIAVESSEHPELGVRARVSPAVPERDRARCERVRDQIVTTLSNEAEWRHGALRPDDGRVVLDIGSETELMELHLPEGYVARSTGMAVDVYQTHHVIQRWPPPPTSAVDDGYFGTIELERRLSSEDAATLDAASPRLDIVTAYAGGFAPRHGPRGERLQVGARRLAFGRVLDGVNMPGCTTASDRPARGSDFTITYIQCGTADAALIEVLRTVRLIPKPSGAER